MALTAAQLQTWEEDGFLLLTGAIPRAEVGQMGSILAHDAAFLGAVIQQTNAAGKKARQSWRAWELPEDDVYAAFCRHPAVGRRVEELLGDTVFHFHHKMIMKEAHTAGSWEWHHDYGYWHTSFLRSDLASCLIAIEPSNRANGCLEVMRGSHKAGRLEHGPVGQRDDQAGRPEACGVAHG